MKKPFIALLKPFMADPSRWCIHFPIGGFTAWAGSVHWVFALCLTLGFLAYEISEDWRIKDKAYIDIQGWLWGLGIGIIAVFLTK